VVSRPVRRCPDTQYIYASNDAGVLKLGAASFRQSWTNDAYSPRQNRLRRSDTHGSLARKSHSIEGAISSFKPQHILWRFQI